MKLQQSWENYLVAYIIKRSLIMYKVVQKSTIHLVLDHFQLGKNLTIFRQRGKILSSWFNNQTRKTFSFNIFFPFQRTQIYHIFLKKDPGSYSLQKKLFSFSKTGLYLHIWYKNLKWDVKGIFSLPPTPQSPCHERFLTLVERHITS